MNKVAGADCGSTRAMYAKNKSSMTSKSNAEGGTGTDEVQVQQQGQVGSNSSSNSSSNSNSMSLSDEQLPAERHGAPTATCGEFQMQGRLEVPVCDSAARDWAQRFDLYTSK